MKQGSARLPRLSRPDFYARISEYLPVSGRDRASPVAARRKGSFMETRFSVWLEQGIELYRRNFAVLALASLLGAVLSVSSAFILSGPMWAGLVWIALRLQAGSEPKPEAPDVLRGLRFFAPAFLFSLVWGGALLLLSWILSTLPCIGPLLIPPLALGASVLLAFGPFLIVDRGMDFWTASRASLETVRSRFMDLLGILAIALVLGGLGGLFCLIGWVLTAPLTACILAQVYRDLFAEPPDRAPRPEMVSLDSEPG